MEEEGESEGKGERVKAIRIIYSSLFLGKDTCRAGKWVPLLKINYFGFLSSVSSPPRLRHLSHFSPLPSLERLYLGMNRVQDFSEVEKLCSLTRLIEFSIISNPVSSYILFRSDQSEGRILP